MDFVARVLPWVSPSATEKYCSKVEVSFDRDGVKCTSYITGLTVEEAEEISSRIDPSQFILIAGEDATLLYLYECKRCGSVILYDYSNPKSIQEDSCFCPNCQQKNDAYEVFYTKEQIASSNMLQGWIIACRNSGVVPYVIYSEGDL